MSALRVPLAAALLGCAAGGTASTTAAPAGRGLTIDLTVPAATPADANIYVAGTFNRWSPGDPAYRFTRVGTDRYRITLPDSVRGAIEFKFTLGSWETVELNAGGGDVPNRTYRVPSHPPATVTATVEGWRNATRKWPLPSSTATTSVSIIDWDFRIPQLGRTRRIWIYLPPDYATSTRTYPVLYMQDGQNLFDAATSFVGEWGVDETLDSLHRAGDTGVIVVAVDHGYQRRFDEYSPWVNSRHGGGEGDEYVEFLVATLKPFVDAHYRTRPDRLSTAIAGSSMGGVISLYAMLKHPEVFGRAAVFSPALWVTPELLALARAAAPRRPDPRIYFVVGAREGQTADEARTYVADQAQMVDTLAAAGFAAGTEISAHVRPDGEHNERFWRREFAAAYRWLFR